MKKGIRILLMVVCFLQVGFVFAENNVQANTVTTSETLSPEQIFTQLEKSFKEKALLHEDYKEDTEGFWAGVQEDIDKGQLTEASYSTLVEVLPQSELDKLFFSLARDSGVRKNYEVGDTTNLEARIAQNKKNTKLVNGDTKLVNGDTKLVNGDTKLVKQAGNTFSVIDRILDKID